MKVVELFFSYAYLHDSSKSMPATTLNLALTKPCVNPPTPQNKSTTAKFEFVSLVLFGIWDVSKLCCVYSLYSLQRIYVSFYCFKPRWYVYPSSFFISKIKVQNPIWNNWLRCDLTQIALE